MASFKASPERAERVRKIVEFLRTVPIGGAFDYGALRAATGVDMNTDGGRSLLYRAMNTLNEEVGATWGNIPGSGYERFANSDVHKVGVHARLRIRNTAKRSKRRIENAIKRSNDLDPKDNHRMGVEVAILGLVGRAAEDRTVEMVEKAAPGAVEVPTMRNFADFLARNS